MASSLLCLAAVSLALLPRPPSHASGARRWPSRPLSHPGCERRRAPKLHASLEEAVESDGVVVIGSGIGGLSCACLLARYGVPVLVLESHVHAGGAAHSFTRRGYTFDSGPSLWAGLARPSVNPLRQVLDAVGESSSIEWAEYDGWGMVLPEGRFFFRTGDEKSWEATLDAFGGQSSREQWAQLLRTTAPVTRASAATPPMVLRSDPWVLLPLLRCLPGLLTAAPHAALLNGPFSATMDAAQLKDPFVKAWLDYLAFALSGLDARGTLGAAVAFTLGDLYRPGATLDYPIGGSGAVIEALCSGVAKFGGEVRTGAHVERLLVEGGRAAGVVLRSGEVIRAGRAVVSNADVWATVGLIPPEYRPPPRRGDGGALNAALPMTPSFMHLHLGFRGGEGLPEGLGIHYSVILDDFYDIEAERNMVIISIPTLLDPALAPDGHHVLHAYYAADEPYEAWENVQPGTAEYDALKVERAAPLWTAVERIIPDIRSRVVVEMVASPLTHERFLRRSRGTYGPPLFAGDAGQTIPYAKTQLEGLLHCGDSCFPGIGVPSAAASGINAANTLVSPWLQLALMDELESKGQLNP